MQSLQSSRLTRIPRACPDRPEPSHFPVRSVRFMLIKSSTAAHQRLICARTRSDHREAARTARIRAAAVFSSITPAEISLFAVFSVTPLDDCACSHGSTSAACAACELSFFDITGRRDVAVGSVGIVLCRAELGISQPRSIVRRAAVSSPICPR